MLLEEKAKEFFNEVINRLLLKYEDLKEDTFLEVIRQYVFFYLNTIFFYDKIMQEFFFENFIISDENFSTINIINDNIKHHSRSDFKIIVEMVNNILLNTLLNIYKESTIVSKKLQEEYILKYEELKEKKYKEIIEEYFIRSSNAKDVNIAKEFASEILSTNYIEYIDDTIGDNSSNILKNMFQTADKTVEDYIVNRFVFE